MCNLIIVIFLVLTFQVLTLNALCNHTNRHLTSNSVTFDENSTNPASLQHPLDSNYSNSLNMTDRNHPHNHHDIHQDLRLEYYKYKIVSYLDISTDPDYLNPDLDEELRDRIRSSRGQEKLNTPVINSRQKRSLACSEVKADKKACCMETFYVNFTEIGWDKWILYPSGYNANYCRGQCDLSHARYYHSTLLSKFSSIIGLCCSPRQMAPLRLLYIDENNKVLQKTVPDMIVESCDCA